MLLLLLVLLQVTWLDLLGQLLSSLEVIILGFSKGFTDFRTIDGDVVVALEDRIIA